MHATQKRYLSMFRRVRELLTTDAVDPTIAGPLAELDGVITRLSEHGITQDTLNRRTLAMLEHAQTLYGGEHDFILAITQGSYNQGVEASFGTHDGGGAGGPAGGALNGWRLAL